LTVFGCNPISKRVIYLRLAAKPLNISVVQVYAPTAEEDKEEFYRDISMALTEIPKRDFLLILGNWNAKVGEELDDNITGRWGASNKK
jgi:exonuclease III